MRRWDWSGDMDRFLANMPAPVFRQRDIYDVCDRLKIQRWRASGIWRQLQVTGRIIRTSQQVGRSPRWRYWERSNCSIRIGKHNERLIQVLMAKGHGNE